MGKSDFRSHRSKAYKRPNRGPNRRPDTGDKQEGSRVEVTAMETANLEAYMNKGTLLRVRLGSNEEFVGRIEWYDQAVINLTLADGSRNVVIFKHAIASCEEAA